MQRGLAAKEPDRLSGVIDLIADGLSLAISRPFLITLPVLLDLYYWLGWRVSIQSLTSPLRTWVEREEPNDGADLATRLESLGETDVTEILSLFVPSLLSGASRSSVYSFANRPEFAPAHWGLAVTMLLGLALGATMLLVVYAVPLADAALNRSRPLRATLTAIGRAWLRSLGLHALAIGVALLLTGPMLIGSAALLLVGVDALPLAGFATLVIAVAGFLVWWFAVKAIVVSEVGPLRAVYYGFAVVRSYFWQTVGYTAAWLLITVGLGRLWREIADTAPGLLAGVVANALFAGGLAMAGMLFYETRIRSLRPVLTR